MVTDMIVELDEAGTATEIAAITRRALLQLRKAHNQLTRCETQFRMYEGQHRAKGTVESEVKAGVNAVYAADCAEART